MEPSLPPLVVPTCNATPCARARRSRESTYAGGVTDELSSARATAPAPIGATAKLGSSSGESAETNVSIAWTRRVTRDPRAARDEPAGHVALAGVHERRLALEQRRDEAAAGLELERAVVADGGDPKSDLVHVRHEHDLGIPLTEAHPQVARGVGLALRPRGQEPLHRLAHRPFRAGDAVGFHEGGEDGLSFRDSRGVLGGQTDRGTGGQQHRRHEPYRPSARPPVRPHLPSIHCTISRCNLSTSASATVSTAVSV